MTVLHSVHSHVFLLTAGTNAMLPNNALNAMLSPDHKGRLHGDDGLSIAPSPPNIKSKSEGQLYFVLSFSNLFMLPQNVCCCLSS